MCGSSGLSKRAVCYDQVNACFFKAVDSISEAHDEQYQPQVVGCCIVPQIPCIKLLSWHTAMQATAVTRAKALEHVFCCYAVLTCGLDATTVPPCTPVLCCTGDHDSCQHPAPLKQSTDL